MKKRAGKQSEKQNFQRIFKTGLVRKKKGSWGSWEQRVWAGMDPNSSFHKQ